MQNYVQPGENLTLAAPYDVASGAGALIGSIFGVASTTTTSGNDCVFVTEGVFLLAKTAGQAWTQGAKVYWDNTAKNVTTTVGSNTLIGVATVAALSADTTGYVYLDGAIR
ncbi:MAG: DUF2190 family protein [Cypionkella sp.]